MKYFFSLFLLVAFSVNTLLAQPSSVTVILQNNLNNKKIFNANLDGEQTFLFRKKQLENVGVIESLNIKYPTHIFFSNLIVSKTGSQKMTYGSLIVFPGDSISIINDQVYSRMGFAQYIDQLLLLREEDYNLTEKWFLEKLKVNSIRDLVNTFNEEYESRQKKIYANRWNFNDNYLKSLEAFNVMLKYKKFASIPFDKVNLNTQDISTLDSIYREIDLKNIADINSPFKMSIYYNLIKYQAFIQKKMTDSFWDYALKVDEKVLNQDFYVRYLVAVSKSSIDNNSKILDKIISNLRSISHKNEKLNEFQSVIFAVKKSKVDFNAGKEELNSINKGEYNYLLGSAEKESIQRDIKLLKLSLANPSGKREEFLKVILKPGEKLTLIDFWASWCIPCIQENPFFLKVKNNFKNQLVNFVNISIDKDIDKNKWINMALKINNAVLKNQYIVPDEYKSVLKKFFNLNTIPRYVLINQKGEILNYDFDRPSNTNFENSLKKYLSEL